MRETWGPRVDHRGVGERHALPALVAVHRVEAAGNGAEIHTLQPRDVGFELRQVFDGAARGHVTPVEEGVDAHRDAVGRECGGQCHEMILHGMHTAGRQDPHHVRRAAALLQFRGEFAQRRQGGERAVLDRRVDAHEILHDHAAGPQIHVADFRISHLALGQADMALGGFEERGRMQRAEAVEVRRAGEQHGVVRALGAMAEAVENAKDDRAAGRSGHALSSIAPAVRAATGREAAD